MIYFILLIVWGACNLFFLTFMLFRIKSYLKKSPQKNNQIYEKFSKTLLCFSIIQLLFILFSSFIWIFSFRKYDEGYTGLYLIVMYIFASFSLTFFLLMKSHLSLTKRN